MRSLTAPPTTSMAQCSDAHSLVALTKELLDHRRLHVEPHADRSAHHRPGRHAAVAARLLLQERPHLRVSTQHGNVTDVLLDKGCFLFKDWCGHAMAAVRLPLQECPRLFGTSSEQCSNVSNVLLDNNSRIWRNDAAAARLFLKECLRL